MASGRRFCRTEDYTLEAILTALVVDHFAGLEEKKINGEELTVYNLTLPGAVLLISLSLFSVK